MHNNGVYHRDLKDENIVIDRHLRVSLSKYLIGAVSDILGQDN
jgi:serine/threonine protein kinase